MSSTTAVEPATQPASAPESASISVPVPTPAAPAAPESHTEAAPTASPSIPQPLTNPSGPRDNDDTTQQPKKPVPSASRGLQVSANHIDAFLAHLNRCLQTPAGVDSVLQFTCYAARLTAALLATGSLHVLSRDALAALLSLTASPTSGRTVLIVTGAAAAKASRLHHPHRAAAAARILLLSRRLKALSVLASETRMITRLWGLLGMYFWAKRLAAQITARYFSSSSPTEKDQAVPSAGTVALDAFQLLSCTAYQALENTAYLSARGILGLPPQQQATAYRWSSRFWGALVFTEIARLGYGLYHRPGRLTPKQRREGGAAAAKKQEEETVAMRKMLVRNVAWAPLTVHWGTGGFLGELAIAAIASVPASIGMRDLWLRTAE